MNVHVDMEHEIEFRLSLSQGARVGPLEIDGELSASLDDAFGAVEGQAAEI